MDIVFFSGRDGHYIPTLIKATCDCQVLNHDQIRSFFYDDKAFGVINTDSDFPNYPTIEREEIDWGKLRRNIEESFDLDTMRIAGSPVFQLLAFDSFLSDKFGELFPDASFVFLKDNPYWFVAEHKGSIRKAVNDYLSLENRLLVIDEYGDRVFFKSSVDFFRDGEGSLNDWLSKFDGYENVDWTWNWRTKKTDNKNWLMRDWFNKIKIKLQDDEFVSDVRTLLEGHEEFLEVMGFGIDDIGLDQI